MILFLPLRSSYPPPSRQFLNPEENHVGRHRHCDRRRTKVCPNERLDQRIRPIYLTAAQDIVGRSSRRRPGQVQRPAVRDLHPAGRHVDWNGPVKYIIRIRRRLIRPGDLPKPQRDRFRRAAGRRAQRVAGDRDVIQPDLVNQRTGRRNLDCGVRNVSAQRTTSRQERGGIVQALGDRQVRELGRRPLGFFGAELQAGRINPIEMRRIRRGAGYSRKQQKNGINPPGMTGQQQPGRRRQASAKNPGVHRHHGWQSSVARIGSDNGRPCRAIRILGNVGPLNIIETQA